MMEVKRSPTVQLLDYVGPTNNDSNSADASALLKNTNTTAKSPTVVLDDELLKNDENLKDDLDFQDAVDDTEVINSDLEDALLADDDLLLDEDSKVKKIDIDTINKAENSTDLGDDLDKLLSKINDVVEGGDLKENGTKADDNAKECAKIESEMPTVDKEKIDPDEKENKVEQTEKEAEKSSNTEKIKLAEKDSAKSSDIEKIKPAEKDSAKSSDLEKIKPAEKDSEKSSDLEKIKPAEKDSVKSSDLEKIKPAEKESSVDQTEDLTTIEEPMEVDDEKDKSADTSVEIIEDDVIMTENVEPAKTNEALKLAESVLKDNATEQSEIKSKEQKVEPTKVVEIDLEEGEIGEDSNEEKDKKEEGEIQDEIFTLELDDDDDDDDVVEIKPDVPVEKVKALDKKMNENQEIFCLDDDDDDDECLPTTTTDNVEKAVESVESEAVKCADISKDEVVELESETKKAEVLSKDAEVAENEVLPTPEEDIKTDKENKTDIADESKEQSNEESVVTEIADKELVDKEKIIGKDLQTQLEQHENEIEQEKAPTISTESDAKAVETESDSKAVETESDAKAVETESDAKAVETESAAKAVETESDAKAVETESKETINESAKEDLVPEHESRGCESASEAPTETETSTVQGGDADEPKDNASKMNNLIADNTDNACDGSEGSKPDKAANEESIQNTQTEDDARSEASSGSNLLQEGQAPSESDFDAADNEGEEVEDECEADEVEDVDLTAADIENETEKEKTEKDIVAVDADMEVPPAKRLRLSADEAEVNEKVEKEAEIVETAAAEELKMLDETSNDSNKMQIVLDEESVEASKADSTTTAAAAATVAPSVKRPFSASLETDAAKPDEAVDDNASEELHALKKPKTDDEQAEAPKAETLDSKVEQTKTEEKPANEDNAQKLPTETTKDETDDCKEEIKQERLSAVPSKNPIPLYPPPKFEEETQKLSLDFLQRFRKTFNQMTKNDLEELVMQKVVEAIVYENQFADLRLIIEKQEKVISLHRTKLAQLVKQYRDLEMVHTRVVKDMREKNSQYLMPVRITRAVGLQVTSPIVRANAQGAPNTAATSQQTTAGTSPTAVAGVSAATRSPQSLQQQQQQQQQIQKRLASPQRPQQQVTNAILTKSPTSSAAAAATAPTPPVRRGCMQKVTAQRPVHNGNTNVSASTPATITNPPMASIPASSFSRPSLTKNATSPGAVADASIAGNPTRILNKHAQPLANSRARYTSGSVNSPSPTQNQTPSAAMNRHQLAANNAGKINEAVKNKLSQQQLKRPSSSPTMNAPNANKLNTPQSAYEQYKNSLSQAMPNNVSITAARPKEKSVIDLTDEDDVPMQAAQPSATPPVMTPRSRPAQQAQINNNNNNANNRQNFPPALTRMPSSLSVRPQITPRQLSSMQNQKGNMQQQQQQQPATITTPNNTSITRISVNQANPASQRIRYGHPAPLPPTPPQQFNPGWKFPPPRPTIRISNMDSGIVISWTMDEPLDRHAEVTTYQIYAYQETNALPSTDSWRHVGDVKAMLLPMAVTLTQFQEDQRYFFSVRAMDIHQRYGPFSPPKTWS